MKRVAYWAVGDTVVSLSEPDRTWIVASVKESQKDRWVRIEAARGAYGSQKKQAIEGNEEFIQQMGFVGYRNAV